MNWDFTSLQYLRNSMSDFGRYARKLKEIPGSEDYVDVFFLR